MNIAELKAWFRGTKWIRKNLGKQDRGGFVLNQQYIQDIRRDHAETNGEFVYYVVKDDTNLRKSCDGVPTIYATREAAEDVASCYEDAISVAEYNRMYARFMITDGYWTRTY